MLRISITEFLEELGFEVSGFGNGTKAFEATYDIRCDLYVLDVNVPGMSGFEFLRSRRAEGIIEVILDTNGAQCNFVFKDYGIGIQSVDAIFQRYYRENHDKGGFGIGLNIVKSIIDKAGITLRIDSVHGKGSEFVYTFTSPIYQK